MSGTEDIFNIRKYTNTRTQVRNLIKEFNLSRTLSVPTETLDFKRQQISLDGLVEVSDDNSSFIGKNFLRRGYYLTFEPDWYKLQLWHKLNSPFSVSVDSSLHTRDGVMKGIPLPIKGPDNGLNGSVQLATGFDGIDDWVDIPNDNVINMSKTLEGFTYHIKMAPCGIELSNGQPVTIYAKKDQTNAQGWENTLISVIMPDGSINAKVFFQGKEYTVSAPQYLDPSTTEFGIHRWYDHTLIFDRINKKLELLIDDQLFNSTPWDNPHLVPYPTSDTDWHVARSTYTNRGLFWGGLADFRYYWDLKFNYQHNTNLYNNRISITRIPKGQTATIGHSYITHSLDLNFTAGFLPNTLRTDGKGFLPGYFMMYSEPVENDLHIVYDMFAYPKIDNDLNIIYDITYTAPVANTLELVYDIQGGAADGTISNDLFIQYDILGTGGGGGGTPSYVWGAVADWDGSTVPTAICNALKDKNITQVVIPGDFTHTADANDEITACNILNMTPVGPPPPPTCPEGQHLDTVTNTCIPDVALSSLVMGFGGDSDNATPQNLYTNMKNKGATKFGHLGDVVYDSSAGTQLGYITSRLGFTQANMACSIGNHDHPNENGSQSILDDVREYFGLTASTICQSRIWQNVYVIAMNTQDSNFDSTSSAQYLFVKAQLENATAMKAAGSIKWIFVMIHKPFYIGAGNDHPANEEGGRSIYQTLFDQHQVDIVWHGHNHNVDMTKPLKSGGIQHFTLNGTIYDFSKPHGQFYFTIGSLGRSADSVSNNSNSEYTNGTNNAYALATIDTTGLNLKVEIFSGSGALLHTVNISKIVSPPTFVNRPKLNEMISVSSPRPKASDVNAAGVNALWSMGEHEDPAALGTTAIRTQVTNYFGVASPYYKVKKVSNVYYMMLNSQDPSFATPGNTQITWARARLEEMRTLRNAGQVAWTVVGMHKPFYNKHSTTQPLTEVGGVNIWQPLFDEFQVDIVLHGHQHVLEASKPLKTGGTVQGNIKTGTTNVWDFTQTPHGQFYMLLGGGGATLLTGGVTPAPAPVSGDLLWSSNTHGHWNNGVVRTVTDSEGDQSPDGKGFFMAASGNPELRIKGNGEADLAAGAGHGRVYCLATNFDSVLQGEFRINTSSIENTTWKLRSRHGESGDCENRIGGFGCHVSRSEAGFQIEKCHNEHEPAIEKALPKPIATGQWVKFRFTVKNVAATSIFQQIEIDYNDGAGFRVVNSTTRTNAPFYYVDKDTFMEQSYFWIRINNDSAGSVTYKNVTLTDIGEGSGGGTGGGGGTGAGSGTDLITATETPTWQWGASSYGFGLFTIDTAGLNMKVDIFNQNGSSALKTFHITKGSALPQSCPTGQHFDSQQNKCVPDTIQPPPTMPVLRIGVISDSDANATLTNCVTKLSAKQPHQLIHCGNFTHSADAVDEIAAYTTAFSSALRTGAIWARGNQEASNENGSIAIQNAVAIFFNTPTTTFLKAKQIQNVYIIGVDTNDPNYDVVGSTQYNYIVTELNKAATLKAAGTVNWIIIVAHRPHYANAGSNTAGSSGTIVNANTVYQSLFNQHQVDFVLHGHNRSFQVSEPLTTGGAEQFQLFGAAYDFTKTHGQIYLTTSASGRGNYPVGTISGNFRYINNTTEGFTMLNFDSTGLRCNIQLISATGTILHQFDVVKTLASTQPPPSDGGGGTIPGGIIDSNGIKWLEATGQQGVIPKSREQTDDRRWSGNVSNVSQKGYEVTAILTAQGVASDGHFALKHWGPNHSGDCGYEEDGECCCWYDVGVRANGDVQTQIERPHPHNEDWPCPTCLVTNIGVSLNNNTVGLKWIIYPLIDGGSADNGGIKMKFYYDEDPLGADGRPRNNWKLVYDITDTGQILGDYEAPSEHDIEVRNSDTDSGTMYAGGIHWRKRA